MPRGLAAVISSDSGDLTVRGLASHARLQAGSGDIGVTALSGGVRIEDQSGDITGTSVSGPQVFIKNESGDITITGLASKDVAAQDQSGTIALAFTTVPDRVVVSGESGDIRLVLPPGSTAYRVRASTESGLTNVTVPRNDSSAHLITVTGQSGDITVTQ